MSRELTRQIEGSAQGREVILLTDVPARHAATNSIGQLVAEDPDKNFFPAPGVIETLNIPGGPGVRFDTGVYPGYTVPPYYDSLLGKLIVWDQTRVGALARLVGALDELEIGPGPSTASLHRALVREPDVQSGAISTLWLEDWLSRKTEKATAHKSA